MLAAIARRLACEGRTDDPRTTDGANQNIDARTGVAAGGGIAAAEDTWLTAADIPAWVAEGLREAIRRKCAEESQAAH